MVLCTVIVCLVVDVIVVGRVEIVVGVVMMLAAWVVVVFVVVTPTVVVAVVVGVGCRPVCTIGGSQNSLVG